MKRENIVYIIFVISIIAITSYFAIEIINQKNGDSVLFGKDHLESEKEIEVGPNLGSLENGSNMSCNPCDKLGESKPNCTNLPMVKKEDIDTRGVMKPKTSFIYDGSVICLRPVNIRTNKYGFRGIDWSRKRKEDRKRIVLLGDSMFFGLNIPFNSTVSQVLERKTKKDLKENYQTLNLAVPGYNLREKIEILKEIGLGFDPEIVVLEYTDDLRSFKKMKEIREKLRKKYPKMNPVRLSIKATEKQTKKLEEKSFDPKWNILKEQLERLEDIKERNNLKIIFFVYRDKYFQKLKDFSIRHNWSFIPEDDSYNYGKINHSNSILHEEDSHPSILAHKVYADMILKEIKH